MSTVGELKTDVRSWTARDDLTDAVFAVAFRTLEAELARKVRVRAMETRATLTATSETVPLPSDYVEMISLTRDNEQGAGLVFTTATRLRKSPYREETGAPLLVAIEGSNILVYPAATSGDTFDLDLTYFARFAALDATSDTDSNWLTINVYDLMLYGLLMHIARYFRDKPLEADNRNSFLEALESLTESDLWSRFAGEPLEALGPVLEH